MTEWISIVHGSIKRMPMLSLDYIADHHILRSIEIFEVKYHFVIFRVIYTLIYSLEI